MAEPDDFAARPFRVPVEAVGDGYAINLDDDERGLIRRLVDQLRELLTDPEPAEEAQVLLARLFPAAYTDDDELEAEYQRLMRDELVQSKLSAFDIVDEAMSDDGAVDEGRLIAVMQSINSIRLVLGSMLGVTDDPAIDEVDDEFQDSPEYALYGFLSYLLDWCVQALTGAGSV